MQYTYYVKQTMLSINKSVLNSYSWTI